MSAGMSRSVAERTSMAAVSPRRRSDVVRRELGPQRHLRRMAGEGAVVGERGRVIAGVALVGAGAAGGVAGAADAGGVDDRRGGVDEAAGEAGAEGVEGGLDARDAAIGILDPGGAEVVEPGHELRRVGAEEGEVGEAVSKRADRLPEGALAEVVIGGLAVVGVR